VYRGRILKGGVQWNFVQKGGVQPLTLKKGGICPWCIVHAPMATFEDSHSLACMGKEVYGGYCGGHGAKSILIGYHHNPLLLCYGKLTMSYFLSSYLACPQGLWGPECREPCDCSNRGTCSAVDGSCACDPGWTGVRCADGNEHRAGGRVCSLHIPLSLQPVLRDPMGHCVWRFVAVGMVQHVIM
jgi:hypothetical protein